MTDTQAFETTNGTNPAPRRPIALGPVTDPGEARAAMQAAVLDGPLSTPEAVKDLLTTAAGGGARKLNADRAATHTKFLSDGDATVAARWAQKLREHIAATATADETVERALEWHDAAMNHLVNNGDPDRGS